MNEVQINKAYLESLTTDDLVKMADNLGVDIPLDLDRDFVIEEILEISSIDDEPENSVENNDDDSLIDTVLVDSAPLPKQYNITFIEVMIRDPLWAFVFWEIKSQDKEQIEKSQDFEGYYLKVLPLADGKRENASAEEEKGFQIPVKPDDTAWYLSLSPAMFAEINRAEFRPDAGSEVSRIQNQFIVEFCALIKGEETVLTVSNPIMLPPLPLAAEQEPNPLMSLSGYADFRIIRNNERPLRNKKVLSSNE